MTNAQITRRIATLENMYNSMTKKAPLRDKAAITAKIRALQSLLV